jgi:hypothetical protein
LITAPCCVACNGGFSKLDEQFRVFVTSALNVSPVGTKIMREEVFRKSLLNSPKLRRQMARDVFKGTFATPFGPVIVPLIAMDKDVIDRFFERLTKGFLATVYSDVDYLHFQFVVRQLDQFGANHPKFRAFTSDFTADERGDGVFRFWHRIEHDRTTGVWFYQFYDAALFMVAHRKRP